MSDDLYDNADESDHVRKARAKLARQMEEEAELITPAALEEVCHKIYNWIQRHAAERVNLKDKRIALFDENQHSAISHSRFVEQTRSELFAEMNREKMAKLRGRVRPTRVLAEV
jgi:hypothetical protein